MLNNRKNYAVVYDICEKIAEEYRNQLEDAKAVASGELKNFTWDIDWGNGRFQLILNLPEYWYYVEEGRKPTKQKGGWETSLEDIKKWIMFKHLVPSPDRNGKVPTLDQQACAIRTKIHEEGYDARHPLEKAMDKSDPLIDQLVEYVVDELELEIEDSIL